MRSDNGRGGGRGRRRDVGGGTADGRPPYDGVIPARLLRLECRPLPGCPRAYVAESPRARLLGLAGIADLPPDCGLLIPRCRSIHSFGMRFALDVDFLDRDGRVLRRIAALPPRRLAWCRAADAVLERPSPVGPPSTTPGR